MSKKRIVVAGEIFSSNLGDYAIFDSLRTILTSKDVEVIPLDISFRKGLSSINITDSLSSSKNRRSWKIILPNGLKHNQLTQYFISRVMWYFSTKAKSERYWENLIKSSDGVIIGGGQLITDTESFFSPKLNQIVDIAQRHNKPFAILGCGVGDNIGIQAKKIYKKILNQAVYVAFRDAGSVNKVQSYIDNKTILNVYPDLAFALNSNVLKKISDKQNTICGLNVMPLSFFKNFDSTVEDMDEAAYLCFWKRLTQGAINAGMKIVIMTNGNLQDYEQAKTVYLMLLESGIEVTLFDRPQQPSDLYNQIGMIDYLVAMRMHSGIIGQAFGRGVATLVWDQKIPDVWNTVGGQEVVIDSSILKDDEPWIKIERSFRFSKSLSTSNYKFKNKVIECIEECLEAMV